MAHLGLHYPPPLLNMLFFLFAVTVYCKAQRSMQTVIVFVLAHRSSQQQKKSSSSSFNWLSFGSGEHWPPRPGSRQECTEGSESRQAEQRPAQPILYRTARLPRSRATAGRTQPAAAAGHLIVIVSFMYPMHSHQSSCMACLLMSLVSLKLASDVYPRLRKNSN